MTWTKRESSNYIFNYRKDSIAERDIEYIISTQENCYKFICKALGVNMEGKINYYLCSSPEEVGEIYGDNEPCNAFACRPDKVYAVYNDKLKCIGFHEDAHIISYNTLARPKPAFLREGLAMYFDKGYWGTDNYTWVKYFLENDKYITICSL